MPASLQTRPPLQPPVAQLAPFESQPVRPHARIPYFGEWISSHNDKFSQRKYEGHGRVKATVTYDLSVSDVVRGGLILSKGGTVRDGCVGLAVGSFSDSGPDLSRRSDVLKYSMIRMSCGRVERLLGYDQICYIKQVRKR